MIVSDCIARIPKRCMATVLAYGQLAVSLNRNRSEILLKTKENKQLECQQHHDNKSSHLCMRICTPDTYNHALLCTFTYIY